MLAPPDGGLLPVTSRQEMRQEKLAEEERIKKEEERNLLDKVCRKKILTTITFELICCIFLTLLSARPTRSRT